MRLPILAWSYYVTSIVVLVGAPFGFIAGLLLLLERTANIGIIDPTYGGNPLLYENSILVVRTFSGLCDDSPCHWHRQRNHCRLHQKAAYSATRVSFTRLFALAVLMLLSWGSNIFPSGQSGFATNMFSILSFLMIAPLARNPP